MELYYNKKQFAEMKQLL